MTGEEDEWVCPTRMVESMVADLACIQVDCGDCGASRGAACDREKSKDHGRAIRVDDALRLAH